MRRSKVQVSLDGQLEGDVHLSFLSQRDDFRKLYNLRDGHREERQTERERQEVKSEIFLFTWR